uniref:Small ribosomal subunit protein uS7m n=1 Tax=Pelusios castaneus TaxID=367368 RepID=A0A8C8SF23_9SAUR
MAAPMAGRLGSLAGLARAWLPGLIQVRGSRYGPIYLEPIVNKEEYRKPLEELSEEEKNQQQFRALQPIKATPSNVSSSVFFDPTVSKFINMIMKGGNKVLARSIMTQTLEAIKRTQIEKYHKVSEDEKESIECNPYVIFHQALKNCQPVTGIQKFKRGSKIFQVPVPLTDNRRRFLAMKWFVTECRDRKNRRTAMHEKLSQKLLEAFNNEGPVIKRKHDLHKLSESNRAYAHYRWF